MSKARWNNEMGMAEIVENTGSMWTTTGIVRGGNDYCLIEDTLFLAEVKALHVLNDDNTRISLEDIYKKVVKGDGGYCSESFEVYRHLKSLGYIVGRHSVPWTRKCIKSKSVSLEGRPEFEGIIDKECEDKCQITEQLNNIQMNESRPVFDVYPPNSKFKKSSPGNSSFVLCITRRVVANPHPNQRLRTLRDVAMAFL
ncbi:hypothetical protein LguiA_024549 [Lonicera macranthoides]